jgi:hypothetical protein
MKIHLRSDSIAEIYPMPHRTAVHLRSDASFDE